MKTKNISIAFRRKREGKTNYRLRLRLLLSKKPRLVIRNSLKHSTVQLVHYGEDGDRVIVTAHSAMLQKHGWKHGTGNLPAAYLTGLLLGKKAKEANIKEATPDLGLQQSVRGSRLYAIIMGAREAGLDVRCDEEMFPAEERISGTHIKGGNAAQDVKMTKSAILGGSHDEKKKA